MEKNMEKNIENIVKPTILKAHLALNVSNLEPSIDFYSKMLDVAPMKVRPGYAKFDVHNPPLNLTINAGAGKGKGALSHLGLQVSRTEDVIAVRDRWASSGLHPRDEMGASCCYALQDKAWVRDPDGNEWEVFTVLENIEQNNNSCCLTTIDTAR